MPTEKNNRILLYHTGRLEIRKPDIHFGRKNADLGQGFYLTPDEAFARRWAKEQKDGQAVMNTYEMDLSGLKVFRFTRDLAWYDYLLANRSGRPDNLENDVIIGPIANDTLYDTLGIITSGFLSREEALKLLRIGPEYTQVVVKTEKAVQQLTWLSAQKLEEEETLHFQEVLKREQEAYQEAVGRALETE